MPFWNPHEKLVASEKSPSQISIFDGSNFNFKKKCTFFLSLSYVQMLIVDKQNIPWVWIFLKELA